jgi:hypothetical protein
VKQPKESPARTAVLTRLQLCAWLQIGERTFDLLDPKPPRTPAGRFLVSQIIDEWLPQWQAAQKGRAA